jgi:hypothetical protein
VAGALGRSDVACSGDCFCDLHNGALEFLLADADAGRDRTFPDRRSGRERGVVVIFVAEISGGGLFGAISTAAVPIGHVRAGRGDDGLAESRYDPRQSRLAAMGFVVAAVFFGGGDSRDAGLVDRGGIAAGRGVHVQGATAVCVSSADIVPAAGGLAGKIYAHCCRAGGWRRLGGLAVAGDEYGGDEMGLHRRIGCRIFLRGFEFTAISAGAIRGIGPGWACAMARTRSEMVADDRYRPAVVCGSDRGGGAIPIADSDPETLDAIAGCGAWVVRCAGSLVFASAVDTGVVVIGVRGDAVDCWRQCGRVVVVVENRVRLRDAKTSGNTVGRGEPE